MTTLRRTAPPLSAMLSQTLVAFTIEFDNEYERQMLESGHHGFFLSLATWFNAMRFVRADGMSIREFAGDSSVTVKDAYRTLCGFERWHFIDVDPPDGHVAPMKAHQFHGVWARVGYGSPKGLGPDWRIRPTPKLLRALEIWPPLPARIEARWRRRYGTSAIADLRNALAAIVGRLNVTLPMGLPGAVGGLAPPDVPVFRDAATPARLPLPALLSKTLCAFTIEYNRESDVPIGLGANLLRVIDAKGTRLVDLARRTGHQVHIGGWLTRGLKLVDVATLPGRGKVVRLTPQGMWAKRSYQPMVSRIEKRWTTRFGDDQIAAIRASLEVVLDPARLVEGLTPPPGVPRAGGTSTGERSANAEVMRLLAQQTADFIADPVGSLPHYPLWGHGWDPQL